MYIYMCIGQYVKYLDNLLARLFIALKLWELKASEPTAKN